MRANRRIFPGTIAVLAGLLVGFGPGREALAADPEYDVVIRNGTIVDGSGNPWYLGDVAIKGDRIAQVARKVVGSGKREIDAKGLVVTPGFIDIHSHSDDLLLEDGNAQSKIRQGVTLEVLGEGESAGPCAEPRSSGSDSKTHKWPTLSAYFDAVEKSGISVNIVSYVGLDTIWHAVMGDSFARPTDAQFDAMKALIDQAMRDGAFGLSSQLAMPPGSLATTDDIVRLCEVVAKHKGLYSAHTRNEGADVLKSVREMIDIATRANVPVDIIHIKIADQSNWGKMPEIVRLVDEARARGINVQTNVYPYTRGNNNLASIIPPWAHEGGTPAMLERLADPKLRDRLKHDIREGIPGWYNHYTAIGGDWKRMLVNGKGPYEGQTMDKVIAAKSAGREGVDPLGILFEVLIEQKGSVPTIYEHHTEKDMNLALLQPWCSVGSDGLAHATEGPLRRGNPHPRSFGTFPRVLGVYVRERNLLRLEDAVRKMTSLNAAKLGLTDRGSLAAGRFADVVIFDPKTIIDRSTYSDPFHYAEGIVHVLVNGTSVIDNGKHTGARPGRAIRRATPAQP